MIVLLALTLASDPESAYARGLEAADDARVARPFFAESARAYEQLWGEGHRTAPLAANRAQAYLLADDLPNAIRAYREGLRLSPADGRLRRGLDAARAQVAYPTGVPRPRDPIRITHWLSPMRWLLIAFGVYAFGWVALARGRKAMAASWIAAGVLLVGWVFVERGWEDGRPFVVVARDGVTLRQGNADSYPPRIDVPLVRGVEAKVRHRRGGWCQVELADEAVGWLPESGTVSSAD